jgi:hypothetical protein
MVLIIRCLSSIETCRGVIICEIIVHLLVIVQNKKKDNFGILSIILGFFRQNFTETRSVSIIIRSYLVASPKIKLFSIINLYALRLWHFFFFFFCGINALVFYTDILCSKPPLGYPNHYKPLNLIMETDSIYNILCL